MKTIKRIYSQIASIDNVAAAIKKAAVGKRSRAEVQRVLADIPAHAKAVSEMLANQTYVPCRCIERIVKEGSDGKERKIAKISFFPDQIIHWAIILQLQPVLLRSAYKYSCGCMPGRGVHYGKKAVERWLRDDHKHTKYVAKLDIRRFYPSIRHNAMMQAFRRVTSDKRVLQLLDTIVASYSPGLPIGYLTSQWFGNLLLQRLDYHIKQDLKVKYYIRYMDDMILFGNNKKRLRAAVVAISKWLQAIGLELKHTWQIFPLASRSLDFMGFRFYRNKTILRKPLLYRITRAASKLKKMTSITAKKAAAMLSYMGWIKCSHTHNVYKNRIKPIVNIAHAKQIVSRASKNRSKKHANNTCQQWPSAARN